MKNLISFFILIQVGSQLWVNPNTVVGVLGKEKSNYCSEGAEIILTSGTNLGSASHVCSDWDLDIVLKQLSYMYDRR
jgi:hypothetical protein